MPSKQLSDAGSNSPTSAGAVDEARLPKKRYHLPVYLRFLFVEDVACDAASFLLLNPSDREIGVVVALCIAE